MNQIMCPIILREKIQKLEDEILQSPNALDPKSLKTVHYLAKGLYARELTIPKNYMLTGMVHKCEHINIISKGRILVLTEDGPKEIVAPCTLISKPGIKRVGLALEETVWTTIHANVTDETEIEKLEQELVVDTYEDYEKYLLGKEPQEGECLLSRP